MRVVRSAFALTLAAVLTAPAWVDPDEAFVAKRRSFWSFQPVRQAPVPAIADPWVQTPIDAFLLQAQQAKSLRPAPPLGKAALLRRVTLDLTGLPPAPAEVDAFLKDQSPAAYERVVDRLLASPHYGERWAQKWLDVVRYADTNGYELDAERPHAWRYRDYVVASFNADKSYDRFVKEQVAGDELWPGSHGALIATGFHRAGPIHIVGGNQDEEMNRQEVLTEMVYGVSATFLGLTVGCARCHNHKFDPILQADHYRLQAIFAATDLKDVEIATPEQKAAHEAAMKRHRQQLEPIQARIKEIEKPYRDRLRADKRARLEPALLDALDTPADRRTDEQKRLAKDAKSQVEASWDEVVALLSPDDRSRRAELRREMHAVADTAPEPLPTAFAVENRKEAPPTHILKVGDHRMKLGTVEPGFLKVIAAPSPSSAAAGRRSALAQWLAAPDHPLTARVMVNRIWQARMGEGLVRTPNDFGLLGERPTHPALLDWLAAEFVARNWSVKAIDRLIALSSAYRQSTLNAAAAAADPDNRLYARAQRRRLDADAVRDSVLAVTGSLNPTLGGPPVKVPLEPEVYDLIFTEDEPDHLWPVHRDPRQHDRRTMYLLNKRTVRLPLLVNLDQPDGMTSCPKRPTSTHALQALSLLNSGFMHTQAARFASRLTQQCGTRRDCQVTQAYQLALARQPKPVERRMAREFLGAGSPLPDFCLALLNRNEFVYLP